MKRQSVEDASNNSSEYHRNDQSQNYSYIRKLHGKKRREKTTQGTKNESAYHDKSAVRQVYDA
jgi:ABC-type transporter lipoprotein component MlaA